MYSDIIFPEDNEKDFIVIAEKLGYSRIYFCYDMGKIKSASDKIALLSKKTKIELKLAVIAKPNEILKAKNYGFVICRGSEDDRKVMENLKPNMIYGIEVEHKKDSMHYRRSGLDQVLCKLLVKNKISYCISLSMLLEDNRLSLIIGRIMQNIRLCRKYKVNLLFASFACSPYEMRSPHDLVSLAKCLGMDSLQTKNIIEF